MTKKHLPVIVALLTATLNIALLAWFILRVRQIAAMQANPKVTLPPAAGGLTEGDAITLRADGKVYSGETELSDTALRQLGDAIPGRHILLQAAPGANYAEMKALVVRLTAAGFKNIAFRTDN